MTPQNNGHLSLSDLVFGNSIYDYFVTMIIFLVALALIGFTLTIIQHKCRYFAQKNGSKFCEALGKIAENMRLPFASFLALYIASRYLVLHVIFFNTLNAVLAIWVTYQLIVSIGIIVDRQMIGRETGRAEDLSAKRMVHFVVNTLLGIAGFLCALSCFGVNINSLIAGLGVGGVVIAFAAQNILADLFSSFTIILDKPFIVGDCITVGTDSGIVEKIGIKSTRIRSTEGTVLVISNRELTSARVENFKDVPERRVAFTLKIEQTAPSKKLREIPRWIKDIISKEPRARFDNSFFKKIGDASYNFEIVYYILPSDYANFIDTQNEINLAILEKLEKEKIKVANITRPLDV